PPPPPPPLLPYTTLFRSLSRLSLLPLEVWIGGRKLAMGGVAGVASWPDARRQGGVRRLLQHAFGRMRENGQSLSMLAPFSFAFRSEEHTSELQSRENLVC